MHQFRVLRLLAKTIHLRNLHQIPDNGANFDGEDEDDLDNLLLSDERLGGRRTFQAQYLLKSVLVAGRCADLTQNVPPNGLEIQLNMARSSAGEWSHHVADTLVMQNLGYFQFQASPGIWDLTLAPGSRAEHLYSIDFNEQSADLPEHKRASQLATPASSIRVPVRDFFGKQVNLDVRKRPGMEAESLLQHEDDSAASGNSDAGSLSGSGMVDALGSLSGFFGGSGERAGEGSKTKANGGKGEDDDDDFDGAHDLETVHVFSLATGKLYERLMRIMMLSVSKRTSGKVKFWLFENFLSPSFKAFLPDYAEQGGFEVELVTYKWPEWLRQQNEQQVGVPVYETRQPSDCALILTYAKFTSIIPLKRVIWGYKILFLDVLFPLDVKKIIYVDADQVVRGDLRELWDMDLHGAPYGYTPFCDSRKETLGFQFWRSGYWKQHLGHRPYHIR